MPFTFSHPAIVLPFIALRKKWRSSTGLIVGSMAPDFEKFLRMDLHDPYSHTWRSIFYFSLPIGILLCFVFHLIVRNALIDHLPYFLRQRFYRFKQFNWKAYFRQHYLIVFLSLFVGIASHLAWDSFTHKGGLGVRLFPFLNIMVLPDPYTRPIFAVLQQLLSVLGGFVMVGYIWMLPKEDRTPKQKSILGYWIMSGVYVFLVTALWVLAGGKLNRYYLIIAALSAGLQSLIVLPFILRIKERLTTRALS